RSDRFQIGAGPQADLRVPGVEHEAMLLVHPDGSVWFGIDDEDQGELQVGQSFHVGDRKFRIRHDHGRLAPTQGLQPTRYNYRLEATLEGPAGPEAVLHDPTEGRRYPVTTENRAVLLYVLARRWLDDRESGRPTDLAGWCEDEEVAVAI